MQDDDSREMFEHGDIVWILFPMTQKRKGAKLGGQGSERLGQCSKGFESGILPY